MLRENCQGTFLWCDHINWTSVYWVPSFHNNTFSPHPPLPTSPTLCAFLRESCNLQCHWIFLNHLISVPHASPAVTPLEITVRLGKREVRAHPSVLFVSKASIRYESIESSLRYFFFFLASNCNILRILWYTCCIPSQDKCGHASQPALTSTGWQVWLSIQSPTNNLGTGLKLFPRKCYW